MNHLLRLAVIGLACSFAPLCFGQWMWVDKDGRKVFSDQAPGADVPPAKILKRPGNRPAQAEPEAATASAAAQDANAPKVTGRDKALEDKKKQAQAAEAEKKKAQEEEYAKARAENC